MVGRDVDDDVACECVSADVGDHGYVDGVGLGLREELAVEDGAEDTAARITAGVAADEDCGFGDWLRRGQEGWRVENGSS